MDKEKNIIVSAPGKVILHGEHAVVYGKRAIAACLNLRSYLDLQLTEDQSVSVRLPDIGLESRWCTKKLAETFQLPLCNPLEPSPPSEELLKKLKDFAGLNQDTAETKQLAVVAFLYLYCSLCYQDGSLSTIDVHLSSDLPTGAGLGSSAAFSSCLASSFLLLGKHVTANSTSVDQSHTGGWADKDLDLINRWAFQGEKIIHGNPSGLDNSVSCYGGAINFQAGKVTPITSVPVLRVMLFNTKVPRSTKALVAGVRNRLNKYPEIINPLLDSIEAITEKCEQIFTKMETEASSAIYTELQELIDMNQQLLSALGVSHPALDQICVTTARRRLRTKLTGAGGGGCAFTLIPPDFPDSVVTEVKSDITSLGYDCWETTVGGQGVTRHTSVPDRPRQRSQGADQPRPCTQGAENGS